MRIFAWNILHGGGAARMPEIVLSAVEQRADVVMVCEFHTRRGGQLRSVLADHGLTHQVVSHTAGRANGILVASRLLVEERVAAQPTGEGAGLIPDLAGRHVDLFLPGTALFLTAVHIADDSKPTHKATQWNELVNLARGRRGARHLIIGDLNTARQGRDSLDALQCSKRLGSLETLGYKDLCAGNGGTNLSSATWVAPWGEGRRIDAAWASAPLAATVSEARYVQELRESGLSDHAGVLVECK